MASRETKSINDQVNIDLKAMGSPKRFMPCFMPAFFLIIEITFIIFT